MRGTVARWLNRFAGDPDGRAPMLAPQTLTGIYLLAVGAYSLVFYLVPPGYYDRNANLLTSVVAFLALPLVRHARLQPWLVHGLTALTAALLLYLSGRTGGINSHALVWLCMLPISVLLLRGMGAALAWIGIQLLGLAGMYLASARGLVSPVNVVSADAVPWALMNHVLVLTGLLLAVLLYDLQHRRQKRDIERRNAELRQVHQTLIETRAHKEEFLAAVSHELRTPMNAILGFNGVLRQALSQQPEHLEAADHIRHATERLLRVVNDILDFSQLEAGRLMLHRTDFDLHAMLRETVDAHAVHASKKGLTCTLECAADLPAHVRADRQRLLQVIDKLLDNAIRFTDRGGVRLHASLRAGRLRFEVQDSGCGIAPERLPGIFNGLQPLTTPPAGLPEGAGLGLGLGLCERLVRLQSGEIGVSSEVGRGTLFWVEVPCERAALPVPAAPAMHAVPADAPLKILLVDDNTLNLMVARLQIGKLWPHADITRAGSGPQALQQLQAQDFDLALIDMLMPGMDGPELTTRIRQLPQRSKADLPIVGLTANSHPQEIERCLTAGMDAVARKPIDPEKLVHCVNLALQRRRT